MDMFVPPRADKCRVRLAGGPKDDWVYEYPMHWGLAPDKKTIVMRPPEAITTDIGQYVPNGLQEADGTYNYDWEPNP